MRRLLSSKGLTLLLIALLLLLMRWVRSLSLSMSLHNIHLLSGTEPLSLFSGFTGDDNTGVDDL